MQLFYKNENKEQWDSHLADFFQCLLGCVNDDFNNAQRRAHFYTLQAA